MDSFDFDSIILGYPDKFMELVRNLINKQEWILISLTLRPLTIISLAMDDYTEKVVAVLDDIEKGFAEAKLPGPVLVFDNEFEEILSKPEQFLLSVSNLITRKDWGLLPIIYNPIKTLALENADYSEQCITILVQIKTELDVLLHPVMSA